jgi:hypothetical protein
MLEMYGSEALVSSITSHLVKRDFRGEPHKTETLIDDGEGNRTMIALAQGRYRILRLPINSVGGARWAHSILISEDARPSSSADFYYLKHVALPQEWFFKRLSTVCPTPMKAEWADWLWQRGTQPIRVKYINPGRVDEATKKVIAPFLAEETLTPITQLPGRGEGELYRVQSQGVYDEYFLGWREIIWAELGLSEVVYPVGEGGGYANETLQVMYLGGKYALIDKKSGGTLVESDQSLEWLVTKSRMAGIPLELRLYG